MSTFSRTVFALRLESKAASLFALGRPALRPMGVVCAMIRGFEQISLELKT